MHEHIVGKLHTALYHLSSSSTERDRIIASLGEVIWLETLEEVLFALPETVRGQVIKAVQEDDLVTVLALCEQENVPVETILESVADRVFKEEIE